MQPEKQTYQIDDVLFDVSRATVLILAGGTGSRLWPISSSVRPKQFVALLHANKTMLQMTWDRLPPWLPKGHIFVNVAKGFESLALEHLPGLTPDRLIVAPEERNTLPITGYATAYIEHFIPQATILMVAADNTIAGIEQYHDALKSCFTAAQAGKHIIALGVPAISPCTQYGYMTLGLPTTLGEWVFQGEAYLEKPSLETAQRLVQEGRHDWNTGVFAWNADVFFEACQKHASDHCDIFNRFRLPDVLDDAKMLASLFSQLPAQDLDRGLMERLACSSRASHDPQLMFVRGLFTWDDVGNFSALGSHFPKDKAENACSGDISVQGAARCTILCEPPYSLQVEDLSDALIAVSKEGNILVCSLEHLADLNAFHKMPLFNGLSSHKGNRLGFSDDLEGCVIRGAGKIGAANRSCIVNNGPGIVALYGVSDCSITINEGLIKVARNPNKLHAISTSSSPAWITVDENYEALSNRVALDLVEDLKNLLALRPNPVVVFSAGKTPVRLYELLRTKYFRSIEWQRLRFFQMDEYVAHRPKDVGIFRKLLSEALIEPLGLQANMLTGQERPEELAQYECAITSRGGIDLVLHGIGENGHLGFNEPNSPFDCESRCVELAKTTQPAGHDSEWIPTHGVTLGLSILNSARHIRVIASGLKKRAAVEAALLGPRTEKCPASSLQGHPDCRFYLDRAACAWLENKND
ncbi:MULTISPECIES: sugar phosphate nucleotidyltransferase [Pseudomonas]|uniref:Mannose-1-phosphate guanylyltransferase n=1 Tax=Pseudomonas lutea TaxID=243924 RepID=A0A9X8QK32_9PSED|nr:MULTISPECIES: sugar phosphate nucleotidyltransferase [Pseudomonas]SEQ74977.1 Mannose-1-phosphate guanylyltransferase [Pseudomonas lutea]